jgi:hypothetical protein
MTTTATAVTTGITSDHRERLRAIAFIRGTRPTPERFDELLKLFCGAWSVALLDGGMSEQEALEFAWHELRKELAA